MELFIISLVLIGAFFYLLIKITDKPTPTIKIWRPEGK